MIALLPAAGTTAERPGERGVTLVEMVTVAVVLTILTLMISESVINLSTTQAFNEGQARIADIADKVVRGIERDTGFSARVFVDDSDSQSYFDAMDFTGTLAAGSVQPVVTAQGYFDKDPAGVVETGNLLFLGVMGPPIIADLSGGSGTPDPVRVDTLKFVIYYLTPSPSGDLDLGRWGSVPLVRYKDVTDITDPVRRTSLLLGLYQAGVRHAWDTEASTAGAGLYEIYSTGWGALLPNGVKIPEDLAVAQPSLLAARGVHVARNNELTAFAVPAYAEASGPFPGGFEIKVDGPASGKLVLLRLVLAGAGRRTTMNFTEVRRLLSCRDS